MYGGDVRESKLWDKDGEMFCVISLLISASSMKVGKVRVKSWSFCKLGATSVAQVFLNGSVFFV